MPGTEESRKRSEFFRGSLDLVIKALKQIGTGDLYLFQNNDINKIEKITLKKRGVTLTPDQVELRTSPRFTAAEEDKPNDDRHSYPKSGLSTCTAHTRHHTNS